MKDNIVLTFKIKRQFTILSLFLQYMNTILSEKGVVKANEDMKP